MIKLRKILLCNYLFFIVFVFSLIYTFFMINIQQVSIYNDNSTSVVGILDNIFIDGNKLVVNIKAKEDVIGRYYFKKNRDIVYFKNNFKLGSSVRVVGEFRQVNSNTTKYMFNYNEYLKNKNIFYTINISDIYLESLDISLYYKIKNFVIKRFNNNSYLYTFILGDKSYISDDVLNSYRENGISHLFAISGMHITIFSALILKILKRFIHNEKLNYLITSLFLIFYLLLTGLSPSILRGVLFFILFSINKIYYFYIKPINIFLIVISISLFINPFYIYDVSFLYTFSISFSLIIMGNIINRYKHYLSKLLMTSFISFIVSLPITLFNFYQVNLLSIFYNLLYVPLVSIIIFPLSIICFIIPKVSFIFNFFINILESSSCFFSRINLFKFIFMRGNIIIYILYIIFVIVFMIGIYKHKYFLFTFLFILIIIHYLIPYFDSSDYLKMIDVGQGDSILLHSNNKNVLIDTGGKMDYSSFKMKHKSSIIKSLTIPLFKSLGIKKIDYLILTHGG